MRILMLHGPSSGGIGRVVNWLAHDRRLRGWEPEVVSMTANPAALLRPRGPLYQLSRKVSQVVPDLIEAHGWRSGWIAGIFARWHPATSPPVVNVIHSFPPAGLMQQVWLRTSMAAALAPAAYVVVSPALANWLASRTDVPVKFVPMLPPCSFMKKEQARQELGLHRSDLIVGTIGRLTWAKGYDVLLRAWARAVRQHPIGRPWRLCIVGDGPDKRPLWRLAEKLRITRTIVWTGSVPEAGSKVTAFDLYVQPSRSEGAGLAVVEAGRAGIPVIAAAVGGLPDLVGTSALMVPPGNVDQLSLALITAMRWTAAQRQEKGNKLKQHLIRAFPASSVVDPLLTFYRALFGTPRQGLANY